MAFRIVREDEWLQVDHIDGASLKELIEFLKANKPSGIEQRADAGIEAEYLVINDQNDEEFDCYPLLEENGELAKKPVDDDDVTIVSFSHKPEGSDKDGDDYYDIVELIGAKSYRIYDPNNNGLTLDYDAFDCLIGILEKLESRS